ncbi:hypothetical protein MC885_003756 [Smutsia gigantea]|nr:hypothetical protein MC885_003756 [Smutsia gigantea]
MRKYHKGNARMGQRGSRRAGCDVAEIFEAQLSRSTALVGHFAKEGLQSTEWVPLGLVHTGVAGCNLCKPEEHREKVRNCFTGNLSGVLEVHRVATDVFNSKNLAVQAQKKILGKMVSKSIATTLIDDTSSEVLDELYRVTKEYTQNKKEAEKIIKNLIKTVIKLAILYRNNQFNQDELALMEKFKKKVHQLAMTVVSFHQVDYTFDRNVLSRLLNECREMLHQIIQRHLTAKSHGRVNNVFDHFSDCDFLAALYNPFGNFKPHLQKLCDGINKMLDEENI